MTRDLYRPDPAAQAAVLEALAAGSARGRREAELARSVPDRAAALRDVETLLRDMHVSAGPDGRLRDRLWLTDDSPMSTRSIADLAALIVDRVLGAEQDGNPPC